VKGQWPLSMGGLDSQGVEQFGRSAALVSLLYRQLSFLDRIGNFIFRSLEVPVMSG